MTSFNDVRVLVIEDDETSVFVLQNMLEQLGIELDVILHGPNMLEQIKQLPKVDVIFLDLEMPRLNGYEILATLKSLPGLEQVLVIAYTTHISHMSEARVAGFDSFLGKPLNRQLFPGQLARILQGEAVWEVP